MACYSSSVCRGRHGAALPSLPGSLPTSHNAVSRLSAHPAGLLYTNVWNHSLKICHAQEVRKMQSFSPSASIVASPNIHNEPHVIDNESTTTYAKPFGYEKLTTLDKIEELPSTSTYNDPKASLLTEQAPSSTNNNELNTPQSSNPQLTKRSDIKTPLIPPWVDAFYRFTRPYTIVGTIIGVTSVSLLAVQSPQDFSLRFAIGIFQALIPALLINIYIVGLNQVIDVDIDKVNKPYLPVASGEFSLNRGISVTILSAALSLALGAYIGSKPLMWALSLAFLIGTAYSVELPLMRWKQWGFSCTTSILFVRAFVVQFCIYLHMKSFVLGRAAILTKPVIFLSGFMCFLSGVVAIFKDIPDLKGDKVHGMQSFAVQLGQKPVFWACIYTLLAAYGGAILVGVTSEMLWARMGAVVGHALAGGLLWHRATQVDPKDKEAMDSFYMFIWKLLYAEYFLAQFVR